MRSLQRSFLPAVTVLSLALLGCGAGGGGGGGDDVASLGGSAATDDSGDGATGGGRGGRGPGDEAFQDAMLDFAECMRDQGIDFPDPQATGDGGVIMGPRPGSREGRPSEADMEELEAAHEVCQPILEEVEGSMPRLDPEQEAEMREQMLAFAECMREHGIDFPDPVFDEGGRVTVGVGGGPGEGEVDFADDDFREASEECGGEGGFVGAVPAPAGDEGEG